MKLLGWIKFEEQSSFLLLSRVYSLHTLSFWEISWVVVGETVYEH